VELIHTFQKFKALHYQHVTTLILFERGELIIKKKLRINTQRANITYLAVCQQAQLVTPADVASVD